MNKQQVKDAIVNYEEWVNGYKKLCDKSIKVVNLKRHGNPYAWFADVIHYDHSDNYQERYNDCEYPLDLLEKYKLE